MGVKVLSAREIYKVLEGVVDASTQAAERAVSLTVRAIYQQETPGRIDFDGRHYAIGERTELERQRQSDGREWWILDPGDYLVEHNERVFVPKGAVALVRPHERVLVNGVEHGTLVLAPGEALPILPLRVAARGARIERNARLSTLILLD